MYDADSSSARNSDTAMRMPRNTAKESTRTIEAMVVTAPWSRTWIHCHASVPPAESVPSSATSMVSGSTSGRVRSTARSRTMRMPAPASESTGANASQSTLGTVNVSGVTTPITSSPPSGRDSRQPFAPARL